MYTRTIQQGLGALALAGTVALAGCEATQTRPEDATTESTTPAESQPQREAAQALHGRWEGRWDAGGDISITIGESTGPTPEVTYCFKSRCWEPADVALKGAALTFTADNKSLSYRFERDGDALRARLKKGGRTFRSQMERITEKTTSAAPSATQTMAQTGVTPEPSGLAALAGHWMGRWGGGSPSTLTVSGDDPDSMSVEYCYEDECWPIEVYTVDENALAWKTRRGWRFEFTLHGEKVRGTLKNPRGTARITMKRK